MERHARTTDSTSLIKIRTPKHAAVPAVQVHLGLGFKKPLWSGADLRRILEEICQQQLLIGRYGGKNLLIIQAVCVSGSWQKLTSAMGIKMTSDGKKINIIKNEITTRC